MSQCIACCLIGHAIEACLAWLLWQEANSNVPHQTGGAQQSRKLDQASRSTKVYQKIWDTDSSDQFTRWMHWCVLLVRRWVRALDYKVASIKVYP